MQKYPTLKVIIAYPLLLGVIGGALALPFLVFLMMTSINDLAYLGIYFAYCFVIGFIPALLLVILFYFLKMTITNPKDYFRVFLVSFWVVFIYVFLIGAYLIYQDNLDMAHNLNAIVIIAIFVALFEAVASTVLAKFILPKS